MRYLALPLLVILVPVTAEALTIDQARESCRDRVGRPIVQACMRSGGGDLEACRQRATPKVRACVHEALNKANGRANVPLAIPSQPKLESKQAVPDGQPKLMVAPPRTISDITAILDSEKPDQAKIAELQAQANAAPPKSASREDLAQFYYGRGNARAQLGQLAGALGDGKAAVETAKGAVDANMMGRLLQFLSLQYSAAGSPKEALATLAQQIRETNTPGAKGYLFGAYRQMATVAIQMGNLAEAEGYLKRALALIQEARTSALPGWRTSYSKIGQSWEADVELNRAIILEARGQYTEAEHSYEIAELRRRASLENLLKLDNPPPASQILQAADLLVLDQARMKAREGRRVEAEIDARRALLSRLKDHGKYNPVTPKYILGLADVLVEQGRYPEAEKLARAALEINETVGVAEDSQSTAKMLSSLAGVLTLQQKREEASRVFEELDRAIARWEPARREAMDVNPARILSLYAAKKIDSGLLASQALLKREQSRSGDQHFSTATARGLFAIGLSFAGRHQDAIREFRAAAPVLVSAVQGSIDDEDATIQAGRNQRVQFILEAYFSLLARHPELAENPAAETFRLTDALGSHSVQQALTASGARLLVKDKSLSDLVRREQDLGKQVNAQLGLLDELFALPSSERDEKGVQGLNASIHRDRAERQKIRAEIEKRFPTYASLISPKASSETDIRTVLLDGEVFCSFYFGRNSSFVWVIPKSGKQAFTEIYATAAEIEKKVLSLREALEPQAESVLDIPPFDTALAFELYNLLLAPIEESWKFSHNIIVATNGALGFLPLSLLPIQPQQNRVTENLPFASYRDVHWLARTHSVSNVPSAASLISLRRLPASSTTRQPLIGFGDPIFSREQANVEVASADNPITRGVRLARRSTPATNVESSELAQLPRLPDTAEELVSIAKALGADPAQVLKLGADANEEAVKSAALSDFRVVAFATHGLVPGELNGLTQPALALSAPDVANVPGDGLLTMEEILGLKLDADWVVLSACNTGSAAGAGAEAASGLGRAFFYAGARALLVTNWSVYSQPAHQLTADLFRRQAKDPTLARSEALRLAMNALIDGPGYTDEKGNSVFSYAHPIFWAPYTIIGDGGSN